MKQELLMRILKNSPLLNGLNVDVLQSLAQQIKLLPYQQQGIVYQEGTKGESFYIVAKGKVTLSKQLKNLTVPVYTVAAGEHFGETAYYHDSGLHPFTAKAHSETVLCSIPYPYLSLLQPAGNHAHSLFKSMHRQRDKLLYQVAEKSAPQLVEEVIPKNNEPKKAIPVVANQPDTAGWEMLYQRKLKCPYCKTSFTTPKVLSKYIKVKATDSDFCNHYAGINPLFYEVAVCPKCNYAYIEKDHQLTPVAIEELQPVLQKIQKKNYCTVRNMEMSVETLNLAVICQTVYSNQHSVLARLYLYLAWLYRYQQAKDKEIPCLEKSLEHYSAAFGQEKLDIKQELQLIYLIGELNSRLNHPNEAVKWFNRLTMHPEKGHYPAIVQKARERWQDIRAEQKGKKPLA